MSDMLEIDTGDEMATRIAAVGEAVARAAEDLKFAAERLLAEEELVKQAEMTARTAEEQIRQAERQAERAEGAASRMTSSLADAERRAKEATDQFEELEERTSQAELRARAAEEQAAQTAAKSSELLEDLQKTRGQLAEAEGRFRRADERAHAGEEKARLLEEQAQELKARLAEIKKLHLGGVPLVADKERSTLKDAVAGEVRRPLTSILGIAPAMKHTDPKASDSQEMIRQLSSNARKLDRLVSVLLELERLMDGSLKPNRRRTDLQALVRRVVEESPDLAKREVKIEAEHVVVAVDPSMTEQMVDCSWRSPDGGPPQGPLCGSRSRPIPRAR
jgi:K+-sensing histidine kinase KdpD